MYLDCAVIRMHAMDSVCHKHPDPENHLTIPITQPKPKLHITRLDLHLKRSPFLVVQETFNNHVSQLVYSEVAQTPIHWSIYVSHHKPQ